MRQLMVLFVLVGLGGGCRSTASPVGPVRFANQPPVWRVNDRVDVPKQPAVRPHYKIFYHADAYYLAAVRGLNLTRHRRALGVNSLDEVPDSTWFTNRITAREVTPAEIRRGPDQSDPPDLHVPWTIKSSKVGGTSIGFIAEDARGVKFLLKFDEPHVPEVETGADVIVSRLVWAAGYNVPAEHVVHFKRSDLKLAPDAHADDKPIDDAYVDKKLAQVAIGADGRIRGLASVFIEGKSVGGYPRLGVRKDDPNDTIPHELRRDQRGFVAIAAWLGHNDLKEDNTLDAWQEDPADPSRHYLVHYHIDFGKSLGGMSRINRRWSSDYVYNVDVKEWLASLFTFGLHRQPWEGRPNPQILGVGMFGPEHYKPAEWKPNNMAHIPVLIADRFDQFWGAKILIRFTREQIAAAVDAAKYSDPRATQYLIDTLVARQRKTARYWFRQVNPIDELTIETAGGASRLCFTDLALKHKLEVVPTTFTIRSFDSEGRPQDFLKTITPDERGRACLNELSLANGPGRYTILRVESSRGMPETLVHVAVDATTGQPRVIGAHRR